VALPVVGSAALIAAGCTKHRTIVGRALSARPMQWVGARSYSLYLWHWPLLVIPAQYATKELSAFENTGWMLLTIVASAISYRFMENPVRRAKLLINHTALTLAVGAILVGLTIFVAQWQI